MQVNYPVLDGFLAASLPQSSNNQKNINFNFALLY